MLKKIQSPVSGTQQGPQTAVGKFQTSEAPSACLPDHPDPPAETEKLQTSAGNCGNGGSSGSDAGDPPQRCGLFAKGAILLIRVYQKLISPLLPPCCRFEPSCSRYAAEAFLIHGFWKGAFLTIWRLARCQPFCKGGYDPVPPRRKK